jgi:molybdenum cofactor biosynthesis enzyme MoaA
MNRYFNKILDFKHNTTCKSSGSVPSCNKVNGLNSSNKISDFEGIKCKAPFVNMFFDVTGKVHACCLSWKCSDEIFNKNIDQVWKGEKFESIRNHIKENDLNFACNICNSHLKNNNPHLAMINMFDGFLNFNDDYPQMMEFELSNTCNLECIMCNKNFSSSIRKNRDKLPPMECFYDDNFVEQIEKYLPFLKKARFIGGEPFLIDIYYKIWEKIIKVNPEITISVSTNGTILNDRIKEILSKGKFEIVFSIDSLNKFNYEKIRKNADFESVLSNLEYLLDYCQYKNTLLNIAICPMQQNWNELPEFLLHCNKIKADLFFNTVIEPFECALWSLPGEKLYEIQTYLEKHILPDNSDDLSNRNNVKYIELINQIKIWKEKSYKREKAINSLNSDDIEKSRILFLGNLINSINLMFSLSEDDKKEKIEFCTLKIDDILFQLPDYLNSNYLFSILNELDIEIVTDKLLYSSIEELVNDAKLMITNHFYNFEL